MPTFNRFKGDAPDFPHVLTISPPVVGGNIGFHVGGKSMYFTAWNAATMVEKLNGRTEPVDPVSQSGEFQEIDWTAVSNNVQAASREAGHLFLLRTTVNGEEVSNEQQRIVMSPEATGGTFTLTFAGQTTAGIGYNATAAQMQSALEALSNIDPGDVVVVRTSESRIWNVTFKGQYLGIDVPMLTADRSGLTGGTATVVIHTPAEGTAPTNEVQTVSFPYTPTGGTFTLTFNGQTTAAIAYNATAAAVEDALELLSSIGPGNVSCSGGSLPGTAITATFIGSLGNTDVPLMTGDGSNLTLDSLPLTITEFVQGGPAPTKRKWRFELAAEPTSITSAEAVIGDYRCRWVLGTAPNTTSSSLDASLAAGGNHPIFSPEFAADATLSEMGDALEALWEHVGSAAVQNENNVRTGIPGYQFHKDDFAMTGALNNSWQGGNNGIEIEAENRKLGLSAGLLVYLYDHNLSMWVYLPDSDPAGSDYIEDYTIGTVITQGTDTTNEQQKMEATSALPTTGAFHLSLDGTQSDPISLGMPITAQIVADALNATIMQEQLDRPPFITLMAFQVDEFDEPIDAPSETPAWKVAYPVTAASITAATEIGTAGSMFFGTAVLSDIINDFDVNNAHSMFWFARFISFGRRDITTLKADFTNWYGDTLESIASEINQTVEGIFTANQRVPFTATGGPIIPGEAPDSGTESPTPSEDGYYQPAGSLSSGDNFIQVGDTIANPASHSVIRFVLDVDPDVTINQALLKLKAYNTLAGENIIVTVGVEDANNPAYPSDATDAAARTLLDSVTWNIVNQTLDVTVHSINVTSLIQQIVDRAGWNSGQHVQFFLRTVSGAAEAQLHAMESGTNDPVLQVNWQDPAGTTFPIIVRANGDGQQSTNISLLQVANVTVTVDVDETTQGSPGTSERQSVSLSGGPWGGTFTLTYGGQTTAAVDWDATADELRLALEALSNLIPGDVSCSGGPLPNASIQVTFKSAFGNVPVMSGNGASLKNAVITITQIVPGGNAALITAVTESRGRMHWNDALNWSLGHALRSGEYGVIDRLNLVVKYGVEQSATFAPLSVSTNPTIMRLTNKRRTFWDGQLVQVRTTGGLPAGLSAATNYYVVNSDFYGEFSLSLTEDGTPISVTTAGTGTHTIEVVTPQIETFMTADALELGLLDVNSDGTESYIEYRPRSLKINVAKHIVGTGDGPGPSLMVLECVGIQHEIVVQNAGAAVDPDGAVIEITNESFASNKLHVFKGIVAIARKDDQNAYFDDIRVGYRENVSSDSQLYIGRNVTLDTIEQTGGVVQSRSSFTEHNMTDGKLELVDATVDEAYADAGEIVIRAAATITRVDLGSGATLDCSQDLRSKQINALNLYEGSTFRDPHGTVALPNGYNLIRCNENDVTLELPNNVNVTRTPL